MRAGALRPGSGIVTEPAMRKRQPAGRVGGLSASRSSHARRADVPDLTRRLNALERQVEHALTATATTSSILPSIENLLDAMAVGMDRVLRVVGGEPEATAALFGMPLDFLARRWWRVEILGRERLPRRGPMLLVANRVAAAVPYEALVVARVLSQDAPRAGAVRPLVDPWLLELPAVGTALRALGARPATRTAARAVLDAGETAVVFPEGHAAVGKPYGQRYRLAPFRRGVLLRAALEACVPVVPVAVIGAEDAQPVVWRLSGIGRWLGLPAVPISPVPVPLPTKWTLHVGDPLAAPPADADPRAVRAFRARVRERLQGLVSDAVRRRPGLFA
jgi:1-acyl-sn-glycerol-3-phosphate acyltransferase